MLVVALITDCIGWISFAPIVDKIIFAYESEGVTASQINYLSWSYMVAYIPVHFGSVWIIDHKGLRFSIIMGVSVQLLGFWLKLFVNKSFIFCLLG
jgi:hypothetical protein